MSEWEPSGSEKDREEWRSLALRLPDVERERFARDRKLIEAGARQLAALQRRRDDKRWLTIVQQLGELLAFVEDAEPTYFEALHEVAASRFSGSDLNAIDVQRRAAKKHLQDRNERLRRQRE